MNPPRLPLLLAGGLLLAAPWRFGAVAPADRLVLAAISLLVAALWAWAPVAGRRPARALLLPALGLPLLGLVQLALGTSAAPELTGEAVLETTAALVLLWVAAEAAVHPPQARLLAAGVLAPALAQAFYAAWRLSQVQGGFLVESSPYVTSRMGSFVNHNHFAGLMELGTLLAAGLAAGEVRARRAASPLALALGGMALVMAGAVLASRSRGGALALAAGCLALAGAWAASTRGSRRRSATVAGALGLSLLLVVLVLAPAGARGHLTDLAAGRLDLSTRYRLDTALATLQLFRTHPLLGSGLGAYADAVAAFKRGHGDVRTASAESDVLQVVAETGLAGSVVLAALVLRLLSGWRARARAADPRERGLVCGALAALAALLVHGALDFNLHVPSNALAAAVVAGLAAARPSAGGAAPPRRGWAVVFLLVAAAALWRAQGRAALVPVLATADPSARLARLEPILRRHPALSDAHRACGLAWAELAHGPFAGPRAERSAGCFAAALALRPAWAEVWYELAWAQAARGRAAAAREALRRAGELDPTRHDLAYRRAELAAALDGPAEGIRVLRELAVHDPQVTRARREEAARGFTSDPALLDALGP